MRGEADSHRMRGVLLEMILRGSHRKSRYGGRPQGHEVIVEVLCFYNEFHLKLLIEAGMIRETACRLW